MNNVWCKKLSIRIRDAFDAIINVIKTGNFVDIIDICLLSYIVYLLLKLIRETRAGQLMKGIVLLAVAFFVSSAVGMKSVTYIISQTINIGLIAIIVIFQPELRRALEKVGHAKMGNFLTIGTSLSEIEQMWKTPIQAICDTCVELSATMTGALIVIERKTKLGEQIETGTLLNANTSKELLGNIFSPKTPLHDGAVIMRDGIILAAACFLPKPQKEASVNKKLGSRHRAAIGMSENSDAVVIAVSEETGQISVAVDGVLTRDFTHSSLKELLTESLITSHREIVIPKSKKGKK